MVSSLAEMWWAREASRVSRAVMHLQEAGLQQVSPADSATSEIRTAHLRTIQAG